MVLCMYYVCIMYNFSYVKVHLVGTIGTYYIFYTHLHYHKYLRIFLILENIYFYTRRYMCEYRCVRR